MEPTDIVKIPYDLQRLGMFAAGVSFTAILTSMTQHNSNIHKWLQLAPSALLMWFVMVVCGASPYQDMAHTLLAALYLATLVIWDPPIFDDDNIVTTTRPFKATFFPHALLDRLSWHRSKEHNEDKDESQQGEDPTDSATGDAQPRVWLGHWVAKGTVALTIPLQILRLYDWGLQIQRWPIPSFLGATIGWSAGLVLGTCWTMIMTARNTSSSGHRQPRNRAE